MAFVVGVRAVAPLRCFFLGNSSLLIRPQVAAGAGSLPTPRVLDANWGQTQTSSLLKRTARFQEAGEF
jgi:hypothetical protein